MAPQFGRKNFRETVVSSWSKYTRPKLKGLVEGSDNGSIQGWVFDPSSPRSRLSVQITSVEGRSVTLIADRYRADLQAAGIGDGYYGFAVNAARFLNCNRLIARVVSRDFDLPRASLIVRSDDECVRDVGRYKYCIDPHHFPGSRLKGWVVNTTDPLERCRIALVVAGQMRSETIACRRDVNVPLPFDKYHGFVVNRAVDTKRGFSVSVLQADGSLSVLTTLS